MPNFRSPTLNKLVVSLFYLALLGFLALYIKTIDFAIISSIRPHWEFILLGGLFGLAMRYWQVYIWFVILKSLGAENLAKSRFQLVYVYAKTWLGRYIPGTAPAILGKIYFASRHGISKNKLALSSLLEGALQVAVVMALGLLLLTLDRRSAVVATDIKLLMLGVLIVCVIGITPRVFNTLLNQAHKLIRRTPLAPDQRVSGAIILRSGLLYIIGALFYGLFTFFVAKAIHPSLGYGNALFVMGTANLAGALGILAVFTPSGFGVREGVQLLLLGLIMPVELALTITVLARLYDVILDGVFFGCARFTKERAT